MSPTRATALLLTLTAFAVAGCGDDDENGGGAAATSTAPAATVTATTPAKPARKPAAGAGNTDLRKKPAIQKGSGAPPRRLVVEDIVKGKGPGAKAGDRLTMHYVGADFVTGEQFDASWDRGEPFTLELGAGMVIPGWDRGLVGIKKGGRRKLVIPPDLGYGAQGSPPAIGPNATLIFIVDRIT